MKCFSKVQKPLDVWQEDMSTFNNKVLTTILDIGEPLLPPISLDPSLDILLISGEENSWIMLADFSVDSHENLSEIHARESSESDGADQSRHSAFSKSLATVVALNLKHSKSFILILTRIYVGQNFKLFLRLGL